jgi:hypothetical protein
MLVVVLCLLPAVPQASPAAEQDGTTPVLIVDAAHCQMDVPHGQEVPAYEMAASARLVVDASEYLFAIPAPLRDKMCRPNSIQVFSKHGKYSAEWPEQGERIEIGSFVLEPVMDSAPFTRFIENTTYVVGIGYAERDGDVLRFHPFWVGMVEIDGGESEQ